MQSQSMCMSIFIGLNENLHFSSVAYLTSSHIAQTSNFSVSKVHLNSFIIYKFNWLIIRRVEGSRTLTSRRNAPLRPLRMIRAYSLRYKNPVCLHAVGFLLLASIIPRDMIHHLLPATNSLRCFTPLLISFPYSSTHVTQGYGYSLIFTKTFYIMLRFSG